MKLRLGRWLRVKPERDEEIVYFLGQLPKNLFVKLYKKLHVDIRQGPYSSDDILTNKYVTSELEKLLSNHPSFYHYLVDTTQKYESEKK